MIKGQISNQLALGVGVDYTVMVDRCPASSLKDRILGRHDYQANVLGVAMAERLWKRGYRLYVYAVGVADWEWLKIEAVVQSLPVTRLVRVPDRATLGNRHLREVDAFFTDDFDFYDVYRLFKNVRWFEDYASVYNYLRYFGD